jgi:YVTN family beta-propeller protein
LKRIPLVPILVLALASAALSQWLERTLLLPDSFSGLTQPVHLLWDSLDNTVYVGGAVGNYMLVIDDRTGIKKALVPTLFPVTSLAFSPDCRKVYALNGHRKTVLVFDASTHQWLDSFQKATEQNGPCYNPVGRKLYYAGGWDVTVVSCDGDSVLSAIHVHAGFSYPCYVAKHNSVYITDWYNRGVWVVDGVADTFVRFIYTDRHQPCNLEYDWRDDKIYTTSNLWNDSSISVVSCSLNMVIDTIKVFRLLGRLRYNPVNNRLYVADGSSGGSRLAAIDCATDSILHFISVGSGPAFLVFDSLHNRIYCTNTGSNSVSVIDCTRDSVIATIAVDGATGFACYASMTHRLFCVNTGSSAVSVIDTDSNLVVARIPLSRCSPVALCFHQPNGKVYSACGNIDSVAVIASEENTVTALVPVGDRPTLVCSNPLDNKVYCAGLDSSLTVIDGVSDTAIATLRIGAQPSALCFNSTADKVYCAGSSNGTISAIDGVTNNLVATVGVGAQPAALCVNPIDNKVYSANYAGGSVSVISGSSDSVIATVSVGSQPVALCFNSVNDKVYCANSGGASISVIDGASNRLLGHAPAAGAPVALCYNPLADRVYCANSTSNSVTVLDGAADTLLAIVPVGLRPAALSFDSAHNYVYCVNPDGDSVTVIDAAFNTVASRVAVGDNPVALAWVPNVNRMYVANRDGSSVSVINTTPPGVEEGAIVPAGKQPPLVVRGRLLVHDSGSAMLLDATGRLVRRVKDGPNDISELAAGVYFLRASARPDSRKVLLLR